MLVKTSHGSLEFGQNPKQHPKSSIYVHGVIKLVRLETDICCLLSLSSSFSLTLTGHPLIQSLRRGSHLCAALCLYLRLSVSSSISVVPTHVKHFFFLIGSGQPIAGLGWMDWHYQCLGRWVAAAQVISQHQKKKKKNGQRKNPVCDVEGWGRQTVLIRQNKRKPSLFLWAPGNRW